MTSWITFVSNNRLMKLHILILSLVIITASACTQSKADASTKAMDMPAVDKCKRVDREYINHLYGKENDPLKPWLETEKQHMAIQNGEGC